MEGSHKFITATCGPEQRRPSLRILNIKYWATKIRLKPVCRMASNVD
jgi:hypothetical protein